MFNKSIAYRLSIFISLSVIGVFIAFIIITYAFNSRVIKNNIENKAIALSFESIKEVEKKLISTKEITQNIAQQILFYSQHNKAELLISGLMEKYLYLNALHINIDPDILGIEYHNYFFIRKNDLLISEKGNEKIFDCIEEKEIYKKLLTSGQSSWSEVFTCKSNGKMVVSFYVPILTEIGEKNENTIIGSVICELSLQDLNEMINSLKIGENGYAILVSNDGTYLTHPNSDWIFEKNLYSIAKEEYNPDEISIDNVLVDKLTGSVIAYPEYLNYKKCWVYFTPIEETGWTLIFLYPHEEIFSPLYQALLRMLFVSVVGILIIYFVITFITNKLIEPLSTVTSQLKKFSSSPDVTELDTMDEVKLVSDSLNFLKAWYVKYRQNQQQIEKRDKQRRIDLVEASEIQYSLIKLDFSSIKKIGTIDLYAIYKPARIVSGDLFDFFFTDKEKMIFTIGDVSGKGIPAAFFMSIAQTVIKNNSRYPDAHEIVEHVNNELYTTNQHQFFLTLFLGIIDLKTGVLQYCNAAHTITYILKSNGEIVELEQSHGMPLGIYPNKNFNNSKLKLDVGDTLILYTDGVTEMQNENQKHFGNNELKKTLRKLSGYQPEELVGYLENKLELFKGNAIQNDDITLMAINYKGIKKA